MKRTITVKGTGNVSVKPDQIEVSLTLQSVDPEYDRAMQKAADMLAALQSALKEVGFEEDNLKTTNFDVHTEYEGYHDKDGNYQRKFTGYACVQNMSLEFPFDTELLSRTLSAVSRSVANPELNISFNVKDPESVREELLRNAAENARRKAEILADASGVKLGELLSVNYSWGEISVCSPMSFGVESNCMAKDSRVSMKFTPQNIDVSDSATFVWKIDSKK